jgi:hypothetical protein
MPTTEVFYREGTIEIWVYFQRPVGTYVSPDQGVKITIKDATDVVKVDAVAMTASATGKFVYYYTPAADAERGNWHYKALGQDGTGASAKYGKVFGSFEVKD